MQNCRRKAPDKIVSTDRQMDSMAITVYPLPFVVGGKTSSFFLCLQYKSFENTVGKGEIA